MAEFFAGVNVGKVYLNYRHIRGSDGIAQRNTCVGVSRRINNHHIGLA